MYVIETSLQVGGQIKKMAKQIEDNQSPETPRTASADAILVKISDIITNNGRIRIKKIAKVGHRGQHLKF